MAFTDSEIARMRFELGYNILGFDAEPYIGITAIFENIVSQYALSDSATTSATSVTAPTDTSNPSPSTITLSSATGFSAGQRVVVDVDTRRETVTVQSVSGSTITALFTKAHSGTYPVAIESGETIAREILRKISLLDDEHVSRLTSSGLKKVDEIEFFENASSSFEFARATLRNELASALGVRNLREYRASAMNRFEVY